MKLIVGLGNPGKDYEKTRHNIGFMILDNYLGNINWKSKSNGLYYETFIEDEKVIFLKPQTFMNLSGDCVIEFVNFYKISNMDVLVIQDDLDLPLLSYRLKCKSSSGGHNGIKSIISCLGTDEVPRLKVGIAHDKSIDTKDYVLGNFSKEDMSKMSGYFNTFNDIINLFVKKGIEECMAKYNTR